MDRVFCEGSQLVSLVSVPANVPFNQRPNVLEYNNPKICDVIPCKKLDGSYFDLRTGCKIQKLPGMMEWPVMLGTMFRYADGQCFLLSRRIFDRAFIYMPVTESDFRSSSMVFHDIIQNGKRFRPL